VRQHDDDRTAELDHDELDHHVDLRTDDQHDRAPTSTTAAPTTSSTVPTTSSTSSTAEPTTSSTSSSTTTTLMGSPSGAFIDD